MPEMLNYNEIVKLLDDYGEPANPRGLATKEFVGFNVSWDAGLFVRRKRMNFDLAVLESLMMIGGVFDLELIGAVAPNCNLDLFHKQSDYGPRIGEQLPYIIKTLSEDPFSRRAVICFNTIEKLSTDDIACTLSIQFLLRRGYLHSVVTMRSWDLVLGFPADVIMFGMLTQLMARCIDVKYGKVHMNVGSFHAYDHNKELAVAPDRASYLRLTDEWPRTLPEAVEFARTKAVNYSEWVTTKNKSFLRIENTAGTFEVA